GAEFFEAGVEVFSRLAEQRVVGVAERADGVADLLQSGSGGTGERGVKSLGVVRRFAVAVGARDDEQIFFRRERSRRRLSHVDDRGREATFAGFLRGFFREAFSGAGLGTE